MTQAPIDELLKQCPSIYKLVAVSVQRAKELAQGAPKMAGSDMKKVTSIALEEVRQGKVQYRETESDDEGETTKKSKKSKKKG